MYSAAIVADLLGFAGSDDGVVFAGFLPVGVDMEGERYGLLLQVGDVGERKTGFHDDTPVVAVVDQCPVGAAHKDAGPVETGLLFYLENACKGSAGGENQPVAAIQKLIQKSFGLRGDQTLVI